MNSDFLKKYLASFASIEGWFDPDAALMFMAYNQLIAAVGCAGPVLEIGVHRGLSAIAVASLRGEGQPFFAIDLFEDLQSQNVSHSGGGSKAAFLNNMSRFYEDTSFVRTITAASATIEPEDLGSGFSFCHIDGGHSATETDQDFALACRILAPGGLLALDDYFNPMFPGVCEGALRFRNRNEGAVLPLAIGFNKVLFQKLPAPFDLNARFAESFPDAPRSTVDLWERPAYLFAAGFADFIDLDRSSPGRLVPLSEIRVRTVLVPQSKEISAEAGATVSLPVKVVNESSMTLRWGDMPFGLSYHLLARGGEVLRYENPRAFFRSAIPPGEEQTLTLPVRAPDQPGSYRLELDVVWEGNFWFKDRGSPTALVELSVTR
jgi:methyltransferase family protein